MLERVLLEDAMRRAFSLARRGPADDPNPRVGCVLLDGSGRIVAEGWHQGAGTPHAETRALAALPAEWRDRGSELTAVVTLEPCNHTGRTGPCAVSLIEAGIGAVAYAVSDPGAESSAGAERLRAAGVDVLGGVLSDEAEVILGHWLARQTAGGSAPAAFAADPLRGDARRPHVTVKWAQTLDGRAAAADGSSRWITGQEARGDVHRRRAEAQAILVGTGTLLADDPALTARAESGDLLVPAHEQPMPVVLGHRPIPADAQVRRHPALAVRDAREPIRLTGDDLRADLAELHCRGIRSLFVEGGPTVASAFVAAGLADEVLVYLAPSLLGGPFHAIGEIGVDSIAGIKRLRISELARLGADLLIRASVLPPEPPRSVPPITEEAL